MDSHKSLVGAEKPMPQPIAPNAGGAVADGVAAQGPVPMVGSPEGLAGFLEVFIHQARDIHNICIYHKQDVYAKLCLTSDPETAVSTQIINGGGKNPVFNENLRLNVRTVDASLKCEIWMLSRVRNYLEDQLLGFALVPLSDIIMANGKLAQEFSMSSTDLFHSPAGFVQLSLSYTGSSPDVMAIEAPMGSKVSETDNSIPCEYEKIEFPDLKVVNENKMMVSEYFGIPCNNMESQGTENLISECENCPDDEAGIRVVESFSADNSLDSVGALKNDTPLSSTSTHDSLASSDPSATATSVSEKDKSTGAGEGETDSSVGLININIEPEQAVVQQDIVDMYMKSMQQFTESLANMKLPMDFDNGSSGTTENGSSGSDQKVQASKKSGGRVFYGSRAFF